ncbi:MAG: cyclic peptide export ABC transporter [Crocinitomix sp.]|nr:cyclic peptide export ABC transporter [Crocinitomix sp.]
MKIGLSVIVNLSEKSTASIFAYVALSIISGLSGFGFIVLVNSIIAFSISDPNSAISVDFSIMFVGLILAFFLTRRLLSGGIINLSQNIYWNLRKDIVKQVIKAPYDKVKEHKNEIYSTLTNDVGSITQASLLIIDFITSIVLIIASLIYMAYVSMVMFGISLGAIILGIVAYQLMTVNGNKRFNKVRDLERSFMNYFNAILGGAKEISVDPSKGEHIYNKRLEVVVNDGLSNNKKALIGFLNSQIVGQLLFYVLIAFVLLYAGSFFDISTAVIISYVFVLLYILGPIATVMMIIPVISRARISLKRMVDLKKELGNIDTPNIAVKLDDDFSFSQLKFVDYEFEYPKSKFKIGPVNLSINKNEVIFIYGGNGSGKTTLINLILNIYKPSQGNLSLNENALNEKDIQKVKALFSVVLADFYLFDEFYGNENLNREKAKEYLKLFEIDDKVEVGETGFSSTDLSTGQRKRLALIAALLEQKPILILDEWAADQDPQFRAKFYLEIIPIIKKSGITILAITHDDKYYQCADRLFKMEDGKLIGENFSVKN